MTLAKVQAELAALLMEPGRLEAFEAGPSAYARKAGLAGKDAALLAGLPADGMRYFAQRRRIDRLGYLRSTLPRSVALLEGREGGLDAYFAAHPYAFEEPLREAARLARWARTAARAGALSRLACDVVQVEAAAVRLFHAPHRPPKPGARPRRAPGVRLVRVRHDPAALVGDAPWTAAPGAHTAVLQRTRRDVELRRLRPIEVDALRAADGKSTTAQIVASLVGQGHPKAQAAAALGRLRRLGLVA